MERIGIEFYFVGGNRNSIRFTGRDEKGILKPEEVGKAIISDPIDFDFCEGYFPWDRFTTKLKWLVTQAQESVSLGLCTYVKLDSDKYRVIIICNDIPDQPEESKGDRTLVSQKMKLKLVSNISLKESRQEREHGCLVQLARLCGPQNVNIEIVGMGGDTTFPWMRHQPQHPCILTWNEEDLSWEAEVEVAFGSKAMSEIGNGIYSRYCFIHEMFFNLEDDGVRNVLRAMYSGPGDNWKLQKQMLEEGTFSDLVVRCDNPEDEKDPRLFKCHREKLAESSQFFADMLQGVWKEAQTRTINLPESEDAIEAILHFIYYRGTDRIYKARVELLLELLQAGHKYNIRNLVDVAAFAMLTVIESNSLCLETALETFSFVRNVEGNYLTQLRYKCCEAVFDSNIDDRTQSKAWSKMVQIANKLGPGYVSILENLGVPGYIRKLFPGNLDDVKGVKKEEVELFYDFLMSLKVTYEIGVGLFTLAEYLGKPVKEVEEYVKKEFDVCMSYEALKYFRVDYLVEMFCLATNKEGQFWMNMKTKAMNKLKEFQTKQPEELKASQKFKEVFLGNEEVGDEFSSFKAALKQQEEDEKKQMHKRQRLN